MSYHERGKRPNREKRVSAGPAMESFSGNGGMVRTIQSSDLMARSKSDERGRASVDYAIEILQELPFVADVIEMPLEGVEDRLEKTDLIVCIDQRWSRGFGLPEEVRVQVKTGWTMVDDFILNESKELNKLSAQTWQELDLVMLMAASGKADQSSLIVPLLLQILNHQNQINLGENVSVMLTLLRTNELWQALLASIGEAEANAAQTYLENAFGWRWHHILYWIKTGSHLKNVRARRVGHTPRRY